MTHSTNPAAKAFPPTQPASPTCAAKSLRPDQRRDLAVQILAGQQSASQTARDHDVSRKFLAQQTAKAQNALDQAFQPPASPHDPVLFWLPVTPAWIEQLSLSLLLTCHSSLRGVSELFRDLFDYPLAHTTVRNIFLKAVAKARAQNAAVNLTHVRIGAHDEIFQNRQPVLVGCDVDSTYCYLLSAEAQRDAETWGIRLLECVDRGLAPTATIADFGSGLRAGQKEALPGVTCRGDLFHAEQELSAVVHHLERRAYQALDEQGTLQNRQAKHCWRHGRKDLSLAQRIRQAAQSESAAIGLADDVRWLADWLCRDVLAIAGPCVDDRRLLYDFIVAELRQRQTQTGPALKKVCTLLENHREELLAFAVELDDALAALAEDFQVAPALVREVLQHQEGNPQRPEYWQREADLYRRTHGCLHDLQAAVGHLRSRTVRASSVIENLNSRLRTYFFLRRQVGPDYLEVLQFFLNHRRFLRSERAERTGQSPRELLTGQAHAHWLELLCYQRFERN